MKTRLEQIKEDDGSAVERKITPSPVKLKNKLSSV